MTDSAQGYYIEHNGDCWQSVFPEAESTLSQLHESMEEALGYMTHDCGVSSERITVIAK